MAGDATAPGAEESVVTELIGRDGEATLGTRMETMEGGEREAEPETESRGEVIRREDEAVSGGDGPEPVVGREVVGEVGEAEEAGLGGIGLVGLEAVKDRLELGGVQSGEERVLETRAGLGAGGRAVGRDVGDVRNEGGSRIRGRRRAGRGRGGIVEDGESEGGGGSGGLQDGIIEGVAEAVRGVGVVEELGDGGLAPGGVSDGASDACVRCTVEEPVDERLGLDEGSDMSREGDIRRKTEAKAAGLDAPLGLLRGFVGDLGEASDLSDGVSHNEVELGEGRGRESRGGGAAMGVVGALKDRADGAEDVGDAVDFDALADEEELDGRVVEVPEGIMEGGDLRDFGLELGGGIVEGDAEELDRVGDREASGSEGGVRRSGKGSRGTEGGLGGAAREAREGADGVESSEPEIAIKKLGSDEGVVEVPDVEAMEDGTSRDRGGGRRRGVPEGPGVVGARVERGLSSSEVTDEGGETTTRVGGGGGEGGRAHVGDGTEDEIEGGGTADEGVPHGDGEGGSLFTDVRDDGGGVHRAERVALLSATLGEMDIAARKEDADGLGVRPASPRKGAGDVLADTAVDGGPEDGSVAVLQVVVPLGDATGARGAVSVAGEEAVVDEDLGTTRARDTELPSLDEKSAHGSTFRGSNAFGDEATKSLANTKGSRSGSGVGVGLADEGEGGVGDPPAAIGREEAADGGGDELPHGILISDARSGAAGHAEGAEVLGAEARGARGREGGEVDPGGEGGGGRGRAVRGRGGGRIGWGRRRRGGGRGGRGRRRSGGRGGR